MPNGYDGILNLAKPQGMTSHDVVARVRRIAGQRTVGHAGTLDPLAMGVLVLLLGKATSLAGYVMAGAKSYQADVVFGEATTTDDGEGEVCRTAAVPDLAVADIKARLQRFVGEIEQIPPRFSAVKKDGKKAYVEARKGRDPQLAPRPVVIHAIDVLGWTPPVLRIAVRCGSGTYIRSLARDVGEVLGSAAHLGRLVRTASGRFLLENAVALDDLTPGRLPTVLEPPDRAVDHLRSATLSKGNADLARHGRDISLSLAPRSSDEVIRLYGPDSLFLGLARPSGGRWHPFRVLEPAA